MHFAVARQLPKSPTQLTLQPRRWPFRRQRLQTWLAIIIGLVFLIVLLSQRRSGSIAHVREKPSTATGIVIVTGIDNSLSSTYKNMIIANRKEYAALHGYDTFFPNTADYDLGPNPIPSSWSRIPAVRHALAKFEDAGFVWYLDEHSMIMNPHLSLEKHILDPTRLQGLIISNHPVVPPDSVIKTVPQPDARNVDFIITQDHKGLSPNSFIVRRGEWAKFFLDAWFDPLYRSYNFQRADAHALEHLVQWHGTVLAKMGLVPQYMMNAYLPGEKQEQYHDGYFIAHIDGCAQDHARSCENEAAPLYKRFTEYLRKQGS